MYLRYQREEDFNKILNQLREAQNVEEIEFETHGVGEQDNDKIYQVIKKILGKFFIMSMEFDKNISDFFMRLVKWQKLTSKNAKI